jgi:hypothetical protein
MKPFVSGVIEGGRTARGATPAPQRGGHEMQERYPRGFVAQALAGLIALTIIAAFAPSSQVSAQGRTSSPFAGAKANTGRVTLTGKPGSLVLTLSDDFKAPDAPDPHWQVVDAKGRIYLLQKLTVKGLVGDKMNRSITLPSYISDVAKVQFWCAYAEVVLGEASFGSYSTN